MADMPPSSMIAGCVARERSGTRDREIWTSHKTRRNVMRAVHLRFSESFARTRRLNDP